MGHFCFKNWYLYGSTFKFCSSTSLPKPNLSTPPWVDLNPSSHPTHPEFAFGVKILQSKEFNLSKQDIWHLILAIFRPVSVISAADWIICRRLVSDSTVYLSYSMITEVMLWSSYGVFTCLVTWLSVLCRGGGTPICHWISSACQ